MDGLAVLGGGARMKASFAAGTLPLLPMFAMSTKRSYLFKAPPVPTLCTPPARRLQQPTDGDHASQLGLAQPSGQACGRLEPVVARRIRARAGAQTAQVVELMHLYRRRPANT